METVTGPVVNCCDGRTRAGLFDGLGLTRGGRLDDGATGEMTSVDSWNNVFLLFQFYVFLCQRKARRETELLNCDAS